MRKDMKVGLVFGIVILVAVIITVVVKNDGDGKDAEDTGSVAVNNEELAEETQVVEEEEAVVEEVVEIEEEQDVDDMLVGLGPLVDVTEVVEEVSLEEAVEAVIDTGDAVIVDNSATESVALEEAVEDLIEAAAEEGLEIVNVIPEDIPSEPALTEDIYHVVASGDSLSAISHKYFGTITYTKAIYEVNKGVMVKGPDFINVGWKLRIPNPEEIEANR